MTLLNEIPMGVVQAADRHYQCGRSEMMLALPRAWLDCLEGLDFCLYKQIPGVCVPPWSCELACSPVECSQKQR